MNLKSRFLLLMTAIFVAFTALIWIVSARLIDTVNEKWGAHFVERQVTLDKYRTLSPLLREISLARLLAAEPDIVQLALHEKDPEIRRRGIAVLETYREMFRDRSYFAALTRSGNYYYNDAQDQFDGKQLRYVLSPSSPDDRWFYATIADGKEYQVNVDPDTHLGVTKVWINVLIKQGGDVLGVIGTGIDLTRFLDETLGSRQEDVSNFFIDSNLAIQLHSDTNLIDYMSLARKPNEHISVRSLLKDEKDIDQLRLAMKQLVKEPDHLQTMWVNFQDKPHLLGVTFLPEIGWYDLTLMNTESLVIVENRFLLPLVSGLTLMIVLACVGLALRRWVLKPIETLQASIEKMKNGQFDFDISLGRHGEIANLSRSFADMAERVRETNIDLEERVRRRTEELQYSEQRFRDVSDAAGEYLWEIDLDMVYTYVSQRSKDVKGYSPEELLGHTPMEFMPQEDIQPVGEIVRRAIADKAPFKLQHRDITKSGEILWEEVNGTPFYDKDGVVIGLRGTGLNITGRKQSEAEIENLAFFDPLTRLPNRRLLLDRLQQALIASSRGGRYGALLIIDLDNFKTLNDTLGHSVGDLLLIQVAARLESCVRDGDTVARLGGDEFVVVLEALGASERDASTQTEAISAKILDALKQPYSLEAHDYRCTSSVGATLFQGKSSSIQELMKQADIAMYQAKKSGRNTFRFFDVKMQDHVNVYAALEVELHKALESSQFKLYYQIQVTSEQHVLGVEALIRWIHPERGMVSPAQFIPMAEESGLILPIGHWILETACAQLKVWEQSARTQELVLAINVSARQFLQPNFAAHVGAAVHRHGIKANQLKLELTEGLMLEDIDETIKTMNALNDIGVQLSLDDFGTGYSSLQYLKRLPLDQLKIDQSFVKDIAPNNSAMAIVRTIIAMAQSLNLDVIAEGVETEEQRQLLLANDCRSFQGYLFGKPVPIDQLDALLNT
jgi:diguanylate cyclase (GGDEF)-like protein/PAS domain S-box-containing protein